MTPSVALLNDVTHNSCQEPALKRRKLSKCSGDISLLNNIGRTVEESLTYQQDISENESSIPKHPLGIRPLGNDSGEAHNLRKATGGFALLPDELLLQLLDYLDGSSLLSLGSCCKVLYAFCTLDELWKALFLQSLPAEFEWRGTWRSSYLSIPKPRTASISCGGLFSDVLYRPFQCAHIDLAPFTRSIPARNQISRLSNLTPDAFSNDWASTPFVLTSPVTSWPIYDTWDMNTLVSAYGDTSFRAEAVDWLLNTYATYMQDNQDESPLYLFDRAFASKMNLNLTDSSQASYMPPSCFGSDLFSVLGSKRPDSKWLIVGPTRSGSTFHKDPNGTSAWNAVLRGSKYWIMFPSSSPSSSSPLPPPPGVYISPDQSEVTSPLSIAEWLLTFHAEARATPGCKEGVCGPGEVLHVPSGWFHLVVNLDECIAVTQNFVPRSHLVDVLAFLRDRKDQVSGFASDVADPYEEFVAGLRRDEPDLLEEALAELDRRKTKNAWEDVVRENNEGEAEGGFSFGFALDEEEE